MRKGKGFRTEEEMFLAGKPVARWDRGSWGRSNEIWATLVA